MPITLDVSREDIESKSIAPGARFVLRDPRDDEALAIFTGKSFWCSNHTLKLKLKTLQLRTSTAQIKSKKLYKFSERTTLRILPSLTYAAR